MLHSSIKKLQDSYLHIMLQIQHLMDQHYLQNMFIIIQLLLMDNKII